MSIENCRSDFVSQFKNEMRGLSADERKEFQDFFKQAVDEIEKESPAQAAQQGETGKSEKAAEQK